MKRWVRDGEFEAVVDQLYPRARLLALRIVGDEASAADVVAEAFARTFASWRKVRGLAYRDGWVLRVTANLAVDELRRRSRSWKLADRPPVLRHQEEMLVERLDLANALLGLSRRQQEAVVLRHLEGFTEEETAAVMGVARGSVKTHLHRAMRALRLALEPAPEEADELS